MSTPPKTTHIPQRASLTPTYHHETYPRIAPARAVSEVKGKCVVVTGGGGGIGLAIATSFAQAGCRAVAILGRRPQALAEATASIKAAAQAAGSETVVFPRSVDLESAFETEAAFAEIEDGLGKIDILCANAGVAPWIGTVSDIKDPKDLLAGVSKNLCTTFNSLAAFGKRRAEGAFVVHTSTAMTHMDPWLNKAVGYAVGKTAALKAAMYFAIEYPDVHFVYFQPGVVATGLSDSIVAHDDPFLPGHYAVWLTTKEANWLRDRFVWANWDVDELLGMKEKILQEDLLKWNLLGFPRQK